MAVAMQVDEAVDIYRELSKIPEVKGGRICNSEAPGHIRIYSEWSQRDLERAENIKFARNHIVQLDVVISTPPEEITTEQWNKESPSGKYRAVVRKINEKQYVEVWSDNRKIENIDAEKLEKHGKIYEDTTFGCLEWSYSETHLLYVAEKKRPKSKSFFEKKATDKKSSEEEETIRGEEHIYTEHWGEQLVGKSDPVLCVLDVESGVVSTLDNVPDDVSPGQAIWCQDDAGIIFIGLFNQPYRLGRIYCPIRRSGLFYIDLKTYRCTAVGNVDNSVRTPVFSPDHTKLLYLENQAGWTHDQCSKLMMCDWSTKGVVTVVDVVRHPSEGSFPGIYTPGLLKRCWANDSRRIVTSSVWRSKRELTVIDCQTGNTTRLTDDPEVGSWSLLDVHNNLVLATCTSPNQPGYLVLGQLPSAGKEKEIKWQKLDTETTSLPDLSWKIMKMDIPADRVNKQFVNLDYECWVLTTKGQETQKAPLAVYVHGGPHSVFCAEFNLYFAGLCRCGFSILLVNYRGSLGFGQDYIDSLPSNVGTQDVKDVQGAVERILDLGIGDREQVVVIGGSHGGFLTAHLIGQYPDFYKSAVCRNPVINIASMLGSSDIPDWCYVESGLKFDMKQVGNPKAYEEMWKRSPIRYIDQIKTPTMIMLGANDLRVPPKQGHELRKALQARGVPVRCLCYADNSHPIIKVDCEADAFVNIIQWFRTYLIAT